jgi:hypothetical protein
LVVFKGSRKPTSGLSFVSKIKSGINIHLASLCLDYNVIIV